MQERKHRRYKAQGTELGDARSPNALWRADYKGQFRLGNRRYCYPLTITDYRSRYLLACEGLESTKETGAFPVFERAFKEFGLPAAIRTDNGVPFSSPHALFGLSRLSVWWLRLGIAHHLVRHGVGFGSSAEGPPEKPLQFFNSLLQWQRERVPHNPLV